MSWKRALRAIKSDKRVKPTKVVNDCATNLQALVLMAEPDIRDEADQRTAIEKLLGDPPTWKQKPKIKRAPRSIKLTPEDAHAATIFARYFNRHLFGDQMPP
jgi:hypothetical protein